MKIHCIGSSSSGNCYVIESLGQYLIVELTKVCGEENFLARRTFYYERIAQGIMWDFEALDFEFAD